MLFKQDDSVVSFRMDNMPHHFSPPDHCLNYLKKLMRHISKKFKTGGHGPIWADTYCHIWVNPVSDAPHKIKYKQCNTALKEAPHLSVRWDEMRWGQEHANWSGCELIGWAWMEHLRPFFCLRWKEQWLRLFALWCRLERPKLEPVIIIHKFSHHAGTACTSICKNIKTFQCRCILSLANLCCDVWICIVVARD